MDEVKGESLNKLISYGEISYNLYCKMIDLEKKGKDTTDVLNSIKLVKQLEEIKYSELDITEIEHYSNTMYQKINYPDVGIVEASIHSFTQKENDLIFRRISFNLNLEYTKRKNYSESHLFGYSEYIDVDPIVGTFDIGLKNVYVFDRVGTLEYIQFLAISEFHNTFLKVLQKYINLSKDEKLLKIKYDVIFQNKLCEDYFIFNKEYSPKKGINKEVYDYFKSYINNDKFMYLIDMFEEFDDCEIIGIYKTLFQTYSIMLESLLDNIDLEIIKDKYDELQSIMSDTKKKNINKSKKIIQNNIKMRKR